jgi:hypothetical protein
MNVALFFIVCAYLCLSLYRSDYPTGVMFALFSLLVWGDSLLIFSMHSYGEASSTDATLMGATDLLQSGGANVYVRNYLICRKYCRAAGQFFSCVPLWFFICQP